MLNTIRNYPTVAGGLLAALTLVALYFLHPITRLSGHFIEPKTFWLLAGVAAALAFYKGQQAVKKRLEQDQDFRPR